MPSLTLGEAARLTDKSKSTITRAIKGGRLSAERRDDGSYSIDPAELSRVYRVRPPAVVASNGAPPPDETPVAKLRTQLAAAEGALGEAREALGRERETVDDLRRRLDRSEERLTAFLTSPSRDDAGSPRHWWRPWRRGIGTAGA